MAETAVSKVYFVDGCVLDRDYIYLAAKLDALNPEEYEYSRLFFFDRGGWLSHDLEWDVKSVCVLGRKPRRSAASLSIQGEVEIQSIGNVVVEQIPGAGTFDGKGAMMEIRAIGDELVACGYGAQVYRRDASGWSSIGGSLEVFAQDDFPVDLNSVDGVSISDLYAVGYFGRIFHYNGATWTEINSPTNVHLERVRVRDGKVYVCGNSGTLLIGDATGFSAIGDTDVTVHFWGVEVFAGKVYLAALDRLYAWDGVAIAPVSTGLSPEISSYRLDAGDGVLWSFGARDLVWFDGNEWHRLQHPDNP